MRLLRSALIFATVSCLSTPATHAQDSYDAPPLDSYDAPPPYLSIVEGSATLDREELSEPAAQGTPVVPGDRIRTDRGRVELLFPDGSALDVDEFSTIELEGPTLLRVTGGRIVIFAAGAGNPSSAVQFQIDTPAASAQTDGPGEYRVSILGGPSGLQTEMAVVRGAGALVTDFGVMPLRAGERSVAWDHAAPSRPEIFNSASYDAFAQWALTLRDQRLGTRSMSTQYLPADLRMYGGDLDRFGSWNYEAPHGYVWYPRVAPDWRPYYDGYWSSIPAYGWTWIGADAWSWPTHHYGRWGHARGGWFWIPDRHWAPAWVSWGGAPGYVSWSPLGFDNRPVYALSAWNGSGWRGDSWRGWTIVSRDHFGGRRNAHQIALLPQSLPRNVAFVAERSAPVAAPHAVPRRGGGNNGQVSADRRQFPNVVRRTPEGRVPSTTGSPRAVQRQPQIPSAQPQAPDRPSYDVPNRGASRTRPPDSRTTSPTYSTNQDERRTSSARSRTGQPARPQAPVQPVTPVDPRPANRPQGGTATRRSEPIRPAPSAQPDQSVNPQVDYWHRSRGPIYTQRPATPPPNAPAPVPQPPQERAAAPQRQERQNDQGRSRGQGDQQSSSAGQPQTQGGGEGHHRRR